MKLKRILAPFFIALVITLFLGYVQISGLIPSPLIIWTFAYFLIVGGILIDRTVNESPAVELPSERSRRSRRRSRSSSGEGRSRRREAADAAEPDGRSDSNQLAAPDTRAPTGAAAIEAETDDQDSEAPDTSGLPREQGEVKWFNRVKGYGFITRSDGSEVFVHYRGIRGRGRQSLNDGERVSFVVADRDKGLQAEDVVPE